VKFAALVFVLDTLLGTNISPQKSILKMIFLFPRWDMLISWRVWLSTVRDGGKFGPKRQEPPPRKTSKSEPAAPLVVPVEHPPVVKPAETSSVEMRPVEMLGLE